MGELPLETVDERMERTRRPGAAESIRARSQSVRIELWCASAIAANLAAVGVGTETDGSIVCPSAATALVGVKPTLGLVSRSGIIPIAHSQDIAGPMTRTVEDAATAGRAGGSRFQRPGNDDRRPPPGRVSRRPRQQRASRSQARSRPRAFFGYSAVTDRIAETAIADMRAEGAIIIDPANIPNLGKYDASEPKCCSTSSRPI